jgi:hypothetical protein
MPFEIRQDVIEQIFVTPRLSLLLVCSPLGFRPLPLSLAMMINRKEDKPEQKGSVSFLPNHAKS